MRTNRRLYRNPSVNVLGFLASVFVGWLLLLLPTPGLCATAILTWDANSEADLAGYRVYYGTGSGNYSDMVDVHNATTATISNLTAGQTYYFAVTAYDTEGLESGYSNEVVYEPPVEDTDLDGDGMPDAWEQQYGLNPAANDADDDPDHDGITNLNEYLGKTDPTQFDANASPDAPQLMSPANYDLVALQPSLEVGEFYDSDAGDTHGQTEWQIFRQSDGKCVLDLRSRSALTAITVPAMILDAQTDYSWQARFYDNHGQASDWSSPGYFTTQQDEDDTDDNGIPDDQQVDPTVDLDGNGTHDADQEDIKSVQVESKTTLIGLGAGNSSQAVEVSALRSENPDDRESFPDMTGKPGATPFGLINFKVLVQQPGDEAELTVYFSEPVPEGGVWYKYDSINKRWDNYSEFATLSPDRKSLTLYLQDGGEGDADGVANGIIVDPSGLVVVDGNAAAGGGGASGGCFIGASASSRGHLLQPSDSLQPTSRIAISLTILALIGGLAFVLKRRITKTANS